MRLEVGTPFIASLVNSNTMMSREKALRLPADHPCRIVLDSPVLNRLNRRNCRSLGVTREALLPTEINDRIPLLTHAVLPWLQDIGTTEVYHELPGITSKYDDADLIRRTALERINSFNVEFTIYTDGSAFNSNSCVISSGSAGSSSIL